VGADQLGWSTL